MNIYRIIFIVIVVLNCIVFSIYLAVKVIDKINRNENINSITNNNDIETIKLEDTNSSSDLHENEDLYQIEDEEYIPIKTKD